MKLSLLNEAVGRYFTENDIENWTDKAIRANGEWFPKSTLRKFKIVDQETGEYLEGYWVLENWGQYNRRKLKKLKTLPADVYPRSKTLHLRPPWKFLPDHLSEDKIPGGLADEASIGDIAAMHNVSVEEINDELAKGINVEIEHTSSKEIAHEIAKDHLYEDPKYYTKLEKVEKH
jgi:hypothetical protein